MKKCSRCHVPKELENFVRKPDTRDGRTAYCKDCLTKLANERRGKKKEDLKYFQ